jgi:MscS family membrane protein
VLARAGIDRHVAANIRGPLQLPAAVTVIAAGLPFLRLPKPIYRVLVGAEHALIVLALTWLALRALDVLSARTERRFAERRQMAAVAVVPLGRRVLKVVVGVLAVVVALQSFGFNVTGLAAGLGIGGLAIALAAQKTVENLFGGVTLITDQPVRVGDFCRFGETEGVVEDIGLRSTRVRTPDRTVVIIPNAQFSAMPLENLSRRDRIPVRTTLALRNETGVARVREILERLRTMLAAQPKVDTASARARLVRISPQATEIELFADVLTSRWSEYVDRREQILLGALEALGGDATTLK